MNKVLLGMGSFAMDTRIVCPALPKEDSFALVSGEQVAPGGSCANMLVTFAGLGGVSRMIAKIGDDAAGTAFRDTLAKDGVDNTLLLVKPGGVSLHTYVMVTPEGAHSIFVNPGNSMMDLKPRELSPELLDGVDIIYSDLFPAAAAVAVAGMCRQKGIPVVICLQCPPSFMHALGVTDEEIAQAISLADLFISGREGYFELTGCADYREGAIEAHRRFEPCAGVVCTAGAEGAYWLHKSGALSVPAMPVAAVDSTGAGDSFLGALLYSYYCLGESRLEALRFAAGAGALKCTVPGPRLKVPEGQLRAFVAATGG